VFKNTENAGMVRKISFQAKSYLFNLHEMFKNSGSDLPGNRILCLPMEMTSCLSLLYIEDEQKARQRLGLHRFITEYIATYIQELYTVYKGARIQGAVANWFDR
jgi:hypothetical protein